MRYVSLPAAAAHRASARRLHRAQGAYPNKPVRMIVSVGAGGATDTLARKLAEKLSQATGQQFFVENQPAASGVIAAQAVQKAAPDGYTLLIGTNTTHAGNQAFLKNVPYDPLNDFEPITRLGLAALLLGVNNDVPAKSVAGAHGVREGESRQAHVRRRHGVGAPCHRDVQVDRGHRLAERSVQRQPAGAGRPARRADPDPVRRHRAHAAADQGGRGARPRGVECQAQRGRARLADDAGGGRARLRARRLDRGVRAREDARADRSSASTRRSTRRSPTRSSRRRCWRSASMRRRARPSSCATG